MAGAGRTGEGVGAGACGGLGTVSKVGAPWAGGGVGAGRGGSWVAPPVRTLASERAAGLGGGGDAAGVGRFGSGPT